MAQKLRHWFIKNDLISLIKSELHTMLLINLMAAVIFSCQSGHRHADIKYMLGQEYSNIKKFCTQTDTFKYFQNIFKIYDMLSIDIWISY